MENLKKSLLCNVSCMISKIVREVIGFYLFNLWCNNCYNNACIEIVNIGIDCICIHWGRSSRVFIPTKRISALMQEFARMGAGTRITSP